MTKTKIIIAIGAVLLFFASLVRQNFSRDQKRRAFLVEKA